MGLVIAGLHLGGVLVWWATTAHGMKLAPNSARLPTISVSLPAHPRPDAERARRPPRAQDTAGSTRQRHANGPANPTYTADVATVPAATGGSLPAETGGPADAQAPAAPALNLTLSRKDIASAAPRSFAEQSPFRGRLPNTVERQIAIAAAETGPWTEERLDNDRIRFRRGNTCMTAQRPRAANLDPFSEAAARIPWRMSKPQACND